MAFRTSLRRLLLIFFHVWLEISVSHADSSYESIGNLTRDTIHSLRNKRELRPLRNQSDTLTVCVSFSLVSVIELDDLAQKFVVNGFMTFKWHDEIFSWNTSDYGGVDALLTEANNLWRPRVMLVNTVGDMDPFADQMSTTFLSHKGEATWVPGGVFSTSCQLDLEKYPFDKQECQLQFCTMGAFVSTLNFVIPSSEIDKTFFIPNRGWDLINATGYVEEVALLSGSGVFSCPTFKFKMARRPTFFVLYVIIPVILLSLLNVLVFTIPAESGEKISYGITVLLAMYVVISTVSSLLPQASDTVPAVTIYLFSLLAGSVLSVVVSIATVILHERKETIESQTREEKDPQVTGSTSAETHVTRLRRRRSVDCINGSPNSSQNGDISNPESRDLKLVQPGRNACRFWVGANKYANVVSLIIFILMWFASTLSYFSKVID